MAAVCLTLLTSSLPAVARTSSEPVARPYKPQAWGYQPWWMQQNWPAIELGIWQRTIFFELQVAADGTISNLDALPAGWRSMSRAATRCGSALDLAFTLFDEKNFERLFTSAQSRDNLLRTMLHLADSASASGIHLDFEIYKTVSQESVAGFRDFLKRLGAAMRREENSRVLSMFGVLGASQDLLDRESLSTVDFIVVQGYDAHWAGSSAAGPVAPVKGRQRLTWEGGLQHYLNLGAQRSRLLFSIPYYGYEWPVTSDEKGSPATGRGNETAYAPLPPGWVPAIRHSALAQSARHGLLRDTETGSPYYVYRDDQGRWVQGWFEDEKSLNEKFNFIKREKLAGIAAFPLGYDAGKFDSLIASTFGKRSDCRAADTAGDATANARGSRPQK